MTDQTNLIQGSSAPKAKKIAVAIAAILVLVLGGNWVLARGPSHAESVKVVCGLKTQADAPLLDESQMNDREKLAKSLSERADALSKAAGKTSGDIKDALETYARAMTSIADAINADADGASLAEAVASYATNDDLTKAEATIKSITDSQC